MQMQLFRLCKHYLKGVLATSSPLEKVRFRCNICGHRCEVQKSALTRDHPTCQCGSTVRLRAIIHLLSIEFFGESIALPDFPTHRQIVGLDMSGAATYAKLLAKKFAYTNTFLHKSPKLDIMNPDSRWFGQCDFVISSEVFEHVAQPVSLAFDNSLRLLKPNGLLVLTVPYTKTGDTVEHFPDLNDYQVVVRDRRLILTNKAHDGRIQEFDNVVFHGGDGETLEMRVFSESGVLGELRRARFSDIRTYDETCLQHGILWPDDWSLPITARRPMVIA